MSTLDRYRAESVLFQCNHGACAAPLRVARTPMTCEMAVAVFNAIGLRQEPPSTYHYVNVHNPTCPLMFDDIEGCWRCDAARADHPVSGINWAAAELICRHLGGRLPTVAEWEAFASNGDPDRLYPWGNRPPTFELANFDEHFGGTTAVGSFPPSDLGLYDLAGNVSEWCQDWFDVDTPVPQERVVKGGAWSKDARHLQIAASRGKWARIGTTTIGVRPVWDEP
jgi:formylglycine-generating enzyme required for sulfatase activity